MRTCLVVDPSNVVRKVACRIFESMQYVTGEAETGPQAMEKCIASMPDAILIDGHMPGLVATEFLASLRALPNGSKPTILYCTTENDSSELARAVGRRRRLHPEAVRSRKHPPQADLGRSQVLSRQRRFTMRRCR
jgi:two-component system chemotaxis response regulator CheY